MRTSPTGVPLPRGVYAKNGALYRVHRNKWTWLCLDGSERELREALASLAPDAAPQNIGELLIRYVREGTDVLAANTRKEYRRMALGRLSHHFGHMRIDALTPAMISRYRQMREDDHAGPMGNRECSCLSSAYEFGMRRGFAESNPCRGSRRNKERASRVRVTHQQLSDLIDAAPSYWQPFLQAVYLTGWRVMDVAHLRRDQLERDGIRIVEQKNQVEHFKEWSPTLRGVIAAAIAYGDEVTTAKRRPKPAVVFTNRFGQPLTYWAISSQMARLGRPFELRQVRAKAETDRSGTLGHRGQMQARYTRSVRTRPVK